MKKIDVLKIYIFLSLIYLSYNLKNFKNLNQNLKKESITKLTINNPKTDNSLLTMKIKDTETQYNIGIVNGNNFTISSKDQEIIKTKCDNQTIFNSPYITLNSISTKGDIKYNSVSQWKMIYYDSFRYNDTSLGWNYERVSQCNYHFILGGVCQTSYDKLIKTYENIPKHNEIKIEAQYHFIGKWEQNTGYLQVNLNGEDQYVWTGRCKSLDEENYIYDQGMCGYKICKIGEIIKVSLKHNEDKLKLTFGSTLTEDDACVQSYGISEIKIFIR